MLPLQLRSKAVVAVNEYLAAGSFPVGHINLTFVFHGIDQGTYGRNSQGIDAAGRHHAPRMGPGNIPGGVFPHETNAHALTHYVIVSDRNYLSMLAFAQAQAKLTVQDKVSYNFTAGNCSDFAYQVFAHSDLPEKYRLIPQYLVNQREPVAIYAIQEQVRYEDAYKDHPNVADIIVNARLYSDFSGAVFLVSHGAWPLPAK